MAIENETEAPASGVTESEETTPAPEAEEASVTEVSAPATETDHAPASEEETRDVAETPPAEPVEEAAVAEVADEQPSAEAPAEAAPAEDAPAEDAPAAEASAVEDAPAEDAPAAEASAVEDAPAEDAPAAEASAVEDAPAEDAPAAEASAVEDAPAEDAPAAEASAVEDAPAAEVSSEEGAPAADEADAGYPAAAVDPDHGSRPAITAPRDIGDIADELSADDFAEAIDRTVFEFKEGDIVAGIVVRVDPDEALIDIGYKSEGVIPANELSIRNSANPADVVSVGDEIEALVMQKEDESGRLVLSKKRAQYERAWGRIEGVMAEGGTVTGPVIEVVKGGLIVDIGLRGFLPASLVDLRRVRDLQPFVGENIEAKVIELDKNRNNVVLSRRAYLEEAQAEQRQAFLGDLQPGDVRDGTVSSVVNFGAFVDLGGMDGLVHVSELLLAARLAPQRGRQCRGQGSGEGSRGRS